MKIITRFAPSPTGWLHVGNVRTALLNWLYARVHGGTFIFRLDDTDFERSKEIYEAGIKEDLTWLGLHWDQYVTQSSRFTRYEEVKQQLIASGRLYPCYETPEELESKRISQRHRNLPPIYDREALKLTPQECLSLESQGLKPHYRFKIENKAITWDDKVRGNLVFEGENMSDPVVIRADGTFTYMLPSVIDDIDMHVTHIIRGEDHITNTALQTQMFEALHAPCPIFAHVSLLKPKEGDMSKRTGGYDIKTLREEKYEPLAILSVLAHIGTSEKIQLAYKTEDLFSSFDLNHYGKAPSIYDPEEIGRITMKWLHHLSYDVAKTKLHALGLDYIDETFWNAVHGNLFFLSDIKEWWDVCHKPLIPIITDAAFTKEASNLLPEGIWGATTWDEWIEALKLHTLKRGKALFMPLRQALTGSDHGPDLKSLLPLLSRDIVIARLHGKEA